MLNIQFSLGCGVIWPASKREKEEKVRKNYCCLQLCPGKTFVWRGFWINILTVWKSNKKALPPQGCLHLRPSQLNLPFQVICWHLCVCSQKKRKRRKRKMKLRYFSFSECLHYVELYLVLTVSQLLFQWVEKKRWISKSTLQRQGFQKETNYIRGGGGGGFLGLLSWMNKMKELLVSHLDFTQSLWWLAKNYWDLVQ